MKAEVSGVSALQQWAVYLIKVADVASDQYFRYGGCSGFAISQVINQMVATGESSRLGRVYSV